MQRSIGSTSLYTDQDELFMGEKELIQGCIKGDHNCQSILYKTHSPKMFGICLRYAKNFHNAEDILQDGFIKIFKNLVKFRGEGSFEGWMRRIMVNTAIEHYRKSIPMYPLMEISNSSLEVMHDQTISRIDTKELINLLNSLSPGYRTVFNLYVIEGYPHKEIADMLGISEGTSKSQLARARYLLQKLVKDLWQEGTQEKYG